MARKMKDSGIEWIGEIPEEWDLKRIKQLADTKIKDSFIDGDWIETPYIEDKGIRYLTTGNIGDGKYKEQGAGYINVILRPTENICKKYICYLSQCIGFQHNVFEYTKGTTMKRISRSNFGNIICVIPSKKEQDKIVNFLDKKVSEIDTIISKTKETIEEYKKYKQAVITEAVTKGLDKNVPMKDSGIEWIGKIPKNWQVGKIKFCVSKVGSGKTPKGGAEVYSEKGVLFLRSQNIYDTGLVLDEPTYITDEIDEEMKNTRVIHEDVLINITGGSIGRCCIFDEKYGKANVNQHVSIIRVNKLMVMPEFMHYYWISKLGNMAINLYQTGGNREGMSADAIKNSPFLYNSLKEQQEIIEYLDAKCDKIDALIVKKEAFIEEMEKYKKSLIYEYVTGKKEVL